MLKHTGAGNGDFVIKERKEGRSIMTKYEMRHWGTQDIRLMWRTSAVAEELHTRRAATRLEEQSSTDDERKEK